MAFGRRRTARRCCARGHLKNKKGDRYFRPVDVKNLVLIYDLLRRRKFTIDGARDFLKKNKRYQSAGVFDAKTPEQYFTALQKAGYATDPNYVTSGVAMAASVDKKLNSLPSQASSGVQLASASETNKDMKEQLQRDKSTQIATTNKTLNVNQTQTAQTTGKFDDRSALERKQAIV